MADNIKVSGLDECVREFKEKVKTIEGYTAKAVMDVSLDLLGRSVLDAPVDTGTLRGSGYVKINGVDCASGNKEGGITIHGAAPAEAKKVTAVIGFSEIYAHYQHENTTLKHPKGGKAKYLESNFRENSRRYFTMLKNSAAKGLKG